MLKKKTVRNWW